MGVFGAVTHSDGSDGPGGPDRDQSELHEDDAWWLRERQRHETPEAPEEVAEPAAVVPTPPEPEPEPIGVEALAPVAPLFLDDMAEDSGDDYSGVYTAAPYEGLGEGVAEAEERQEHAADDALAVELAPRCRLRNGDRHRQTCGATVSSTWFPGHA